MTERRRFFPATRVQRAPGRTVALEMQLRPQTAPPLAAPKADSCDVLGAGWLVSLTAVGADMGAQKLPEGGWVLSGSAVSPGHRWSYWEGEPDTFNDWGLPLEGPTFRCVRLELASYQYMAPVIVGVLQGRALCDARWTLSWDRPAATDGAQSVNGHVARTDGNMVWVWQFQASGGTAPDGQAEVLTATAACGGSEVAQLVLKITPQ